MNNEDIEYLERINKLIYKRLSPYLRHHPEWEDAVQEGYIHAWKDYEAGNYESDFHLVNRGVTWAKAYLQTNRGGGRRGTGRPRASYDGRVTSDSLKMAEKAKQHVDEYVKLHNKKPRPIELQKALGISTGYASTLLSNYNQMIYAASVGNRDDWEAPVNMDTLRTESNEDAPNSKTFIKNVTSQSFEEDVISEDYFNYLLKQLKPRHAEVITMHFRYGMSTREIGEYYGYEKFPVKNGRANINSALKAVRKILEAEGAGS